MVLENNIFPATAYIKMLTSSVQTHIQPSFVKVRICRSDSKHIYKKNVIAFPSLVRKTGGAQNKILKKGVGALKNSGQMLSTWLFVHSFPSRLWNEHSSKLVSTWIFSKNQQYSNRSRSLLWFTRYVNPSFVWLYYYVHVVIMLFDWFLLLYLTPLSAIFQLYHGNQF